MIIINQLEHGQYRRDYSYADQAPTFVSTGVGGVDEIARWVLDHNGILYRDESHTPYAAYEVLERLTRQPGIDNSPALIMTDGLIFRAESIVHYFESRCAPHLRLIPKDDSEQQVLNLYRLFSTELNDLVQKYVFSRLLPRPWLARWVFNQKAPFWERLRWRLCYSALRRQLSEALNLSFNTLEERLHRIGQIFAQVDALLADGRRYLAGGNKPTLADVVFASVAAPLVLPEEFGGTIAQIQQTPEDYRKDIFAFRDTMAGQFIIRLYQEDRPMPVPQSKLPASPGCLSALKQQVGIFFSKKQHSLFTFLQGVFPVLKIPFVRFAIVSRNNLFVELIERNLDFTIEEINSRNMASQKGAFFLGWDRNNPQFDRERNFARAAVPSTEEELGRIRAIVREEIDNVIKLNRRFGKLDIANTLCRPIYVRLMERYFGVAGPNDQIMAYWARILFYDLFLNLTSNEKVHVEAVKAGVDRRDWVKQVICERFAKLDAEGTLPDNVLNRMILMSREKGYEWVDEDVINRNVGGLLTGLLETSNKAVIYSLSVLFDRPEWLAQAVVVAQDRRKREDDLKITMAQDPMYGYLAECLRFMPVQPGIFRYAEQEQILTGGGDKAYKIKSKTRILCLTAGAMMDPTSFPDPGRFDPTRAAAGAVYKNWGFGLHECFGRFINTVVIPDFIAAVLRLPNLRRDDSMAGRGVGLRTQGGFPNNFVVAFDPPKS